MQTDRLDVKALAALLILSSPIFAACEGAPRPGESSSTASQAGPGALESAQKSEPSLSTGVSAQAPDVAVASTAGATPSSAAVQTEAPAAQTDARLSQDRQARAAYREIRRYISAGNWTAAMDLIQEGLKLNPNDEVLMNYYKIAPRNLLASANLQGSVTAPAVMEIAGGIDAANSNILNSMDSPRLRNSPEEALAASPASKGPSNPPSQTAYAKRLIAQRDYVAADKILKGIIRANPNDGNWEAHRLLARSLAGQGDYASAKDEVTGVLAGHENDVYSLNTLALVLSRSNQWEEALDRLNEAIQISPKDAESFRNRGMLYKMRHQREAMLSDLKTAARLNPDAYQIDYENALAYIDKHPDAFKNTRGLNGWKRWGKIGVALPSPLLFGWVLLLARKRRDKSQSTRKESSPMKLEPGAVVGNFEIRKKLGNGGAGEVYLALDHLLGRPVTLKKMREDLAQDPKMIARFIKEARNVSGLSHPNVVEMRKIVEAIPGKTCIEYEFIDGKTLEQLIEEKKHLPFAEALDILRPVAEAIDYAHARGIIHRDIKPANIIISEEGVVKVMDFAISGSLRDEAMRKVQRETGSQSPSMIGSPRYLAPEQWHFQYFKETDIYSLGLILYEALTGRRTFDGEQHYQNRRDQMFTPVSRIRPNNAPEGIDAIVKKALDPMPGRRYRSAKEFIRALEALAPATAQTPA